MADSLKRAIARMAHGPFFDRVSIRRAIGNPIHEYEVDAVSDLCLVVRVRTDAGPRHFEVRVKEIQP